MTDWSECTIANHNQNKIIGFCLHFNCKSKQRLLCFECMKQTTHDDHKEKQDGVKECSKLPEWLSKQQEDTQNFKNFLNSLVDKIFQPIQIIEKTIENQLEILSESNLTNLTYTGLNDAIRNQVILGRIMDQYFKSNIKQVFDKIGEMLDQLRGLMTETNMTLSRCQRRLNSILIPFSKEQQNNSINQLESVRNNNQPQNNLQGICSYNQIQDNLQDTNQQPLKSLSKIYEDNINYQIDFKTDATIYDGIEYLITGDIEKAYSIFQTLSNQQQKQEVQLWLAYCTQLKKQYCSTMKMMQQLGQQKEYKQNPFFWYIITMSVIGLNNYNDALYSIHKYLNILPHNLKGWIWAGLILLNYGDNELAIKYLLHVLKFEKYNIQAKCYLCLTYLQTNQIALAERQYFEIQQIDPKSKFLIVVQPYLKQQKN